MISQKTSRRNFIKSTGSGLVISSFLPVSGEPLKSWIFKIKEWDQRIRLGLASFTFREFGLDDTIAMSLRMGLKHIALKSFHLSLESSRAEIEAAAGKVRAAGLDLYGCSVVVLKNETEVNHIFEYAKSAGMRMIIAQPEVHLLDVLNKKVREYDIRLAIHNHGPEDKNFPVPLQTFEKIRKLDPRVGLCIDIGHAMRSGADPADSIEKCAGRLIDIHIKDIRTISEAIDPIEVGRGILDIPGVIRSILKIKYSGIVSLEYEKDGKDPLPGVAESLGYIRGVISSV